jgi:hypothetical protein
MGRRVTGRLLFGLALVTVLAAPAAHAQPAPACAQFAPELAALQQQLGAVMGLPTSCPRLDTNGDTIQFTTTGLAVYRPDGMSVFATGDNHWALTSAGLEQWTGNWHNGLYPPAAPEPAADNQPTQPVPDDAQTAQPAPERAAVHPMTLVQVLPDVSQTVVVEDASGSMFTVETAEGCPDVDAAVGDHVFVRSGGSRTDLILVQQHETCAVAAMHIAEGD